MEIHNQSYERQIEIEYELKDFINDIKDKTFFKKKKKRIFKKLQKKKYDDYLLKAVTKLRGDYSESVDRKRHYAQKVCDSFLKDRNIVSSVLI